MITFCESAAGQDSNKGDCSLQKENEIWKSKYLATELKSDRIKLLKEKILADSIYRLRQPELITVHGPINNYEDQDGINCGCKIYIILVPRKTKFLPLDLGNNHDLMPVLHAINTENIDTIYHNLDQKKYRGTNCGVIKLTTKDKELTSLVKNVWHRR